MPSTSTGAINAGYRPVLQLDSTTLPKVYRQLAKAQLTFLVTLTAMAGYALCPAALATSTSVTTLLALTSGTALCSASANALNQLVESPYDAQMPRTRNRPLPTRSVTPLHAATFATVCGTAGVGALAAINPLTALLGLSNIVLYAGMYTPLKRISISNTWLGSLVGALPPLMGWAACTGSLNLTTDMPAWTLAALLFAWQFPHFNSLSHSLSKEYARGGYKMMSVTNPDLNKRTSLRYAIALLPVCSVWLPWTGVVHWSYAILSAPINASMIYAAFLFWRRKGEKDAKFCFWVSLVHLPAILLLAMACKADVVDGFVGLISGEEIATIDVEEENRSKRRKV
jgi:protoheme IX farnesyltransferase